jgi:hypothetical protein
MHTIHKIQSLLREKIPSWGKSKKELPDFLNKLNSIGNELNLYSDQHLANQTHILIGPSFSVYDPSFVLDRLLNYALRLRGVKVTPIYCDQLQSTECNFYGGVWGGGDKFNQNCRSCLQKSQQLWQDSPVSAIKLSEQLSSESMRSIEQKVAQLTGEQWLSYTEDDLPLGAWAKDILVNNYVVGDYHLVENHQTLGVSHLHNLMLLKASYEKVLDVHQPCRVISNDSYYGMWAILESLCKTRKIPYYSHWPVSKDRICVTYADASMNLDFRVSWQRFASQPLSLEQKCKAQNWLNGNNRNLLINTHNLQAHQNQPFLLKQLDPNKPTALLPSNVIWDLAALNKQILFADMIDWISSTINWFRDNPKYQLVIKAHPAEQHPSIPETRERVEIALKERGVILPSNVFLLSPKVDVTAYDLFPYIKVGLVHTTSVGFEMAAYGLNVITTGKAPYRGFGFTHDPENQTEYFNLIERALNGLLTHDQEHKIDLAYKFIIFYQFHYYMKLNLFENEWGQQPKLKIKSAKELMPGYNPHLDYIIDNILAGQPIIAENRWMPES